MAQGTPFTTSWQLFLGPGKRLEELSPFLALAASQRAQKVELRQLTSLAELLGPDAPRERLVLDLAETSPEELGLLRYFLQRAPSLELVLVGRDPAERSARYLAQSPRTRFQAWPLDLDELARLVEAPAQVAPIGKALERAPVAAPSLPQPDATPRAQEMREIERILAPATEPAAENGALAQAAASPVPTAPSQEPAELEPDGPQPEPELVLPPAEQHACPPSAAPQAPPSAPGNASALWRDSMPGFYRQQIADLADIAQRLQLAYLALTRDDTSTAQRNERLGQLEGEVFRLVQFARTLGYLVAPPTGGGHALDLSALLREQLAGWAGDSATRSTFRVALPDGLWVRCDKGLLLRALDAIFALARNCAGAGEPIYVEARELTQGVAPGLELAALDVTFPAGALIDLSPAEIVEPYALRRRFSNLGPNALAASEGILRGQAGRLLLESPSPGILRWHLELPAGRPSPLWTPQAEPAAGPFEGG